MYTFQDFMSYVASDGVGEAVRRALTAHRTSDLYTTALEADEYDHQRNTTIMNYQKYLYSAAGRKSVDVLASNNKLCSNFFSRLNTQRMSYSLGNGVSFNAENIKESLGLQFDTRLNNAAYFALIHGVSFLFWNLDHVHVFPVTEFAPLWDEETGALRAGVRYWQIDSKKPIMAVLYAEDGYTLLRGNSKGSVYEVKEEKRAYRITTAKAPADAEPEIVGEENYGSLPIIPLWGSRLHQSTLVGLKGKIDAYDLISSGLANDFQDCAEIYWIVSNAGGMDDSDLARFRDRLKLQHIANVADADEASVTPYTQEIPTASRTACLSELRSAIYEDFGALDVHTVSAGATNDHIDAAYQPMDENADDFEYQIIEAVQRILALQGKEDTPIFKRNRISNQKELVEMIMLCANYLDEQTILEKLPFITPDEVKGIMAKNEDRQLKQYGDIEEEDQEEEEEEQ